MCISQADIDNSGTIDYGEFLAATVHLNKLEREENLVSAFSFFDKDGSGYITIDELQQACKEFGLSDLHLDEMIKEIDQDNASLFSLALQFVYFFFFFPLKQTSKTLNFCPTNHLVSASHLVVQNETAFASNLIL